MESSDASSRARPWVRFGLAGAALVLVVAVVAFAFPADPVARWDFRLGSRKAETWATELLAAPVSAPVSALSTFPVTVGDSAGLPTVRFTREYSARHQSSHPGPLIHGDAMQPVVICEGNTLGVVAIVVRERTRDACAPDRAFGPDGKPMDAATFEKATGQKLAGVFDRPFRSAYQVAVIVQSSAPTAIDRSWLLPKGRPGEVRSFGPYEWRAQVANRHVLYPQTCHTSDGRIELLLQICGGPVVELPLPEKDGTQTTTPYGDVRRLLTLPGCLRNQEHLDSGTVVFREKLPGRTILFQVSEAIAQRNACQTSESEVDGVPSFLTLGKRNEQVLKLTVPEGATAAARMNVFSDAARVRIALPDTLPHPDFSTWTPVDAALVNPGQDERQITEALMNDCDFNLGYDGRIEHEPTSKVSEVPGAKTYRDLIRHLDRQAAASGCDVQWDPREWTLDFCYQIPFWERVCDFTEEHCPWLRRWLRQWFA